MRQRADDGGGAGLLRPMREHQPQQQAREEARARARRALPHHTRARIPRAAATHVGTASAAHATATAGAGAGGVCVRHGVSGERPRGPLQQLVGCERGAEGWLSHARIEEEPEAGLGAASSHETARERMARICCPIAQQSVCPCPTTSARGWARPPTTRRAAAVNGRARRGA